MSSVSNKAMTPGLLRFLENNGHLFTGLMIDADQMLRTYNPTDVQEPLEPRDVVMRALVENAANSRIAIQRSSALGYWSTTRPQWNDDLYAMDKHRIAHAELDLLEALEEDLVHTKGAEVFAPAWGNLFWTELLNPTTLAWVRSDPAKDIKFSLLPVHDFHALTAKIGSGYAVSLDASMQPTLFLLNCFMGHFQNQVRHKREFPIRLFMEAFHSLFRQFIEPVEISSLPVFSCFQYPMAYKMEQLAKLQVQFLMAHEFGHVLLGHNAEDPTEYFDATFAPSVSFPALSRTHDMEFEADLFAWGFLRDQKVNHLFPEFRKHKVNAQSGEKLDPESKVEKDFDVEQQIDEIKSLRFAIELLFIYLFMFERVRDENEGSGFLRESHPRAQDRLARLRRLFPAGFHRAMEFVHLAEEAASIFGQYIDTSPELATGRQIASQMKDLKDA